MTGITQVFQYGDIQVALRAISQNLCLQQIVDSICTIAGVCPIWRSINTGLSLLGDLYASAPGWPMSIGDEEEALFYFQEALRVDPDWPGNHLAYAKFLLDQEHSKAARQHLERAEALLKKGSLARFEDWEMKEKLRKLRRALPASGS